MPTETKDQRKEAASFRKFLLNEGFMMLQYSIYVRFCTNFTMLNKYIVHIKKYDPKYGNIRTLVVTENQFNSMEIISGSKNEIELVQTANNLTIIE